MVQRERQAPECSLEYKYPENAAIETPRELLLTQALLAYYKRVSGTTDQKADGTVSNLINGFVLLIIATFGHL
jgi:hypothetical protein